MGEKCNDNLFIKPIEFCSKKAINYLYTTNGSTNPIYTINNSNLFQSQFISGDLNSIFRDSENNYNFEYGKEGKKNLCEQTNKIGEYYVNCVIQTSNPLFTYKNGNCIIDTNSIQLPPELKITEDKDDMTIKLNRNVLQDEEGNFKYKQIQNSKYCEDRWYDWIITPNYHLGNRILKDSGSYSKEDVKICYNNCDIGELPFISSSGKHLCIPKEIAYEGKYEKKLDYSPLSLINLIGNNKKSLNFLYKHLYFYKLNQKKSYFDINTDVNLSNDLSDENNYVIKPVAEKIRDIIDIIVNNDNLDNPDLSLDYNNLTYKHPNFKENDLISILGMDKNEILSNPIILIHTAYLAYNYRNFINNVKTDINFISRLKEPDNDFNINTTLNNLEINIYLEKFPNVDIKIAESLKKNYVDNNNTRKKRQRLANILYKAINICYDNKTDFSKNLINRTKKALNSYNNSYIISPSYIKFDETDKNIYVNFRNNNIDDGFEIEYIKYKDLKNFIDEIQRGNLIGIKIDADKINDIKNIYQNNFLFYTEEDCEKVNDCKSGEILDKDGKCQSCDIICIDDECNKNPNCKLFCKNKCPDKTNDDTTEKKNCGVVINDEKKKVEKEKNKEVNTPVEEEGYIPDFSYILKTAVKLFFIFITCYIIYMFYKMFSESILTFANIFSYILDWIYYTIRNDPIKTAEHYEQVIQDKLNKIKRKANS